MSTSALRETTPDPAPSTPVTSVTSVTPRATSAPAAPRSQATATAPWYRRETWLAVTLSAFLPVLVGFLLPQSTHALLLALAALLLLVGAGLLVRRGPTR